VIPMSDISEQFENIGAALQALNDAGTNVHREGIDVVDTNPERTTVDVTFTVNHGDNE